MTDQYDRTVTHISQLNYHFSEMPPKEAEEKRNAIEKQNLERKAAKEAALKQAQEKKND